MKKIFLTLILFITIISCDEQQTSDNNPCNEITCSAHGKCIVKEQNTICNCNDGFHSEGLECKENTLKCKTTEHEEAGICVSNHKMIDCIDITPSNATTMNIKTEITWEDGSWSNASNCDWNCNDNFFRKDDTCILIGIVTEGKWEAIGNVDLMVRFDDDDNGDGKNDGAISVDGADTLPLQGISYTFNGTMEAITYNIKTTVYNYRSSYVKYYVQLYNLTDNRVLISSELNTISGNYIEIFPITTELNYIATDEDLRDTLQVRYIRGELDENGDYVGNDGHVARDFAIDNLSLNNLPVKTELSELFKKPIIDIPSISPTENELLEINLILKRMSDYLLGTAPPSETEINEAIEKYNQFNITISDNKKIIEGDIIVDNSSAYNAIQAWKSAEFIKIFAKYLKFNPNDENIYSNGLTIKEMAKRVIWLFTYKFYKGILREDYINYYYKLFAIPAVFLISDLNDTQYELFYYALYQHSNKFKVFWSEEYITGITDTGAINMDDIGNISNLQLVFGLMQKTKEEKLQWLKAFKRYYERFMSYSPGTSDGIKPDGSSFHHYSALNNYTYNYNTAMKIISILDGTSFQVSVRAYKVLRDAIYAQLFLSNENVEPLSMSGRHPHARGIAPAKNNIKLLAQTGGHILGLTTPDPILTKAYVRQWGNNDFPEVEAEQLSGFAQFNYHTAGVFWKDNWLAVARGESQWGFGAEIFNYPTNYQNVYGRYQSYGALEIIYPGGEENGNGFKLKGWNWNYNPGATTIILPWNKLGSENETQKEVQKNNFVGSLAFNNKNSDVLSKTYGKLGVFAMNFKESLDNHGNRIIIPNTHEETFKFKKSVFFLDDYILALGSNINNEDSQNPTVTTIFQRATTENNNTIIVNNNEYYDTFEIDLENNNDHWIIDNFNTGYYIVKESGEIHLQYKENNTPQENEPNIENLSKNNYTTGYIKHGTNPVNKGYEYIVIPSTTANKMLSFAQDMLTNKPYQIIQKNENAHIIKDMNHNIYAFAIFSSNNNLPENTIIENNSKPCLIIYQETDENHIKLSLSNPDLGFTYRDFNASIITPITITLKGSWLLNDENLNINHEITNNKTILTFNTIDGLPIEIDITKQ